MTGSKITDLHDGVESKALVHRKGLFFAMAALFFVFKKTESQFHLGPIARQLICYLYIEEAKLHPTLQQQQ